MGAVFLTKEDCGARYQCSWRHWLRLVDSGRAPKRMRFGRLARWSPAALEEWERGGCQPIRPQRTGR